MGSSFAANLILHIKSLWGKVEFFVLWKSWNFCILTSLHQYILFTPVQVYFKGLASCVVVFFSLHGLIPTTRIGIRQRNGIYQSLIQYLVTRTCETLVLWHSVCTIYTCWNAKTSQWWWFRWSSTWYKLIPQTLIKRALLYCLWCQNKNYIPKDL